MFSIFFLIIECKISKFYMNDNQWPVENALEFLGQSSFDIDYLRSIGSS